MSVLLAIIAPVIGALIVGLFRINKAAWLVAFTAIAVSIFGLVQAEKNKVYYWPWLPELGLNLSFITDSLALFFAFVVTVMGLFISVYSAAYFQHSGQHNTRFYSCLLLFIAAMIGTVLSNNILVLFIFWELTGVLSFLLIGFNYTTQAGQTGSRMALIITATTGLILFTGLIILGGAYQTYAFNQMLYSTPLSIGLITTAFSLIIIGAIGKSAQFPLHFWLPNAMAAPTPVSAFLHSATMVKLGVFLVARFYPIFVPYTIWGLIASIGFITMVVGAVLSLTVRDIKAILAYTTVSQLGYLIGFYGLGSVSGISHDFIHILNHVLYKGSLFMIAGILIHAFHTQDTRRMGHAFTYMPLAGVAAAISLLSMAGVPGTMGFLSKELMLTHILAQPNYLVFLTMLIIAASSLVATGLRLWFRVFIRPPEIAGASPDTPSLRIQVPAAVLSIASLIIGLNPKPVSRWFNQFQTLGLHADTPSYISLWHGLTPELLVSASILVLGTGLYLLLKSEKTITLYQIRPFFQPLFEKKLVYLGYLSAALTRLSRVNQPQYHTRITLVSCLLLLPVLYPFLPAIYAAIQGFAIPMAIWMLLGASLVAVSSLIITRKWHIKLLSLSGVGLIITLIFVVYHAPDLVMTQILIEVISLILILVFFRKIPRHHRVHSQQYATPGYRLFKASVASGIGVLVFGLVILMSLDPKDAYLGAYFIDNTMSLAEGYNAVNTILVDFRGFDTLGEISVLFIAMLGILGLVCKSPS